MNTKPSSWTQADECLLTGLNVPPDLLKLKGLSREPLLAYLYLWQLAGQRPGTIKTSYLQLTVAFNRSERSARRWIDRLVGLGLIEVLDKQPNVLTIHVSHWARKAATTRTAGQQIQLGLPFLSDDEPMDGVDVIPFSARLTEGRPDERPAG